MSSSDSGMMDLVGTRIGASSKSGILPEAWLASATYAASVFSDVYGRWHWMRVQSEDGSTPGGQGWVRRLSWPVYQSVLR